MRELAHETVLLDVRGWWRSKRPEPSPRAFQGSLLTIRACSWWQMWWRPCSFRSTGMALRAALLRSHLAALGLSPRVAIKVPQPQRTGWTVSSKR